MTGPNSYSTTCSTDSLEIESIVLDTSEIHTLVISWEISASDGGTVSEDLQKDIDEADDLYLDICLADSLIQELTLSPKLQSTSLETGTLIVLMWKLLILNLSL